MLESLWLRQGPCAGRRVVHVEPERKPLVGVEPFQVLFRGTRHPFSDGIVRAAAILGNVDRSQ